MSEKLTEITINETTAHEAKLIHYVHCKACFEAGRKAAYEDVLEMLEKGMGNVKQELEKAKTDNAKLAFGAGLAAAEKLKWRVEKKLKELKP